METLDREGDVAVLKFRHDARIDPVFLMKLIEQRDDLTLLPPAILRLDLGGVAPAGSRPGGRTAPAGTRLVPKGDGSRSGAPRSTADDESEDSSWWTARATAGVASGFTKEQLTARAELDPAAPGGLFEKLNELLSRLSDALVAS